MSLKRRDFLKYGSAGLAGLALGPFARTPLFRIVDAFGCSTGHAWKFGVMADTQWIGTDDGKNPNTVAVDIITQLNKQFIKQGVKFVIQVGDLVDSQSTASLDTTAIFRQALYKAGIGFYPLRGNHEGNQASAIEVDRVFPQTQTGLMNSTPDDAWTVPNADPNQPFPPKSGLPFHCGTVIGSPAAPTGFNGLCYAFDFNNARFVLLDQFTPTTGTSHSTLDDAQITWMDEQLADRPEDSHAFVFGHKGIMTQNHTDGLFGLPSDQPALTNRFVSSLANNGVRHYLCGHDHMHHRAIIASPDFTASVMNITCSSDSSKFYIPYGSANFAYRTVNPSTKAVTLTGITAAADPQQTNDYIYNVLVAGNAVRETPIAQELNTVGFYIYTIDGGNVTVEFYSAVVNPSPVLSSGVPAEYLISATPAMTFGKRETYGYSLSGREYRIAQGESYTAVNETYRKSLARILSGSNGSTATDSASRPLTKLLNTGWTKKPGEVRGIASDVFTLWGMSDFGADHSDTYVLSMSYDPRIHLHVGRFDKSAPVVLAALEKDVRGDWKCAKSPAVEGNVGGKKKFVVGPWSQNYGLGTYGVDPSTHTVWAVLNVTGNFAAVEI